MVSKMANLHDAIRLFVKTTSDDILCRDYLALWQSIYRSDCYGIKDRLLFLMMERELYDRGYYIKGGSEPVIVHRKNGEEVKG